MATALYPTEEKGLFEELINCKELKKQISDELKQETERNNPTGMKKGDSTITQLLSRIEDRGEGGIKEDLVRLGSV